MGFTEKRKGKAWYKVAWPLLSIEWHRGRTKEGHFSSDMNGQEEAMWGQADERANTTALSEERMCLECRRDKN